MIILFEDLSYRQVFLDGRTLPDDPNPTFMGYSVGHWEGDTLVIESNGFNERTWLDYGGHPHSEALRFTERWQRKDFGHVELQVTLNDPKAYAKPWTVAENVTLMPDSDLLEFVCNENEKDSAHLRGPAEVNGIPLSREALAALVGDYDAVRGGPTKTISITLRDNQMLLDFDGKGKVPLIPLTDSNFDSRIGGVQFVKDDAGRVTSLLLGGTQRFTRR